MPPTEEAVFASLQTAYEKEIQEAILADVTDRRGLSQEWDQIDPGIKDDIRAEWRRLLKPIRERIRRDVLKEVHRVALEVELCAPWQREAARDGYKAGWQEVFSRVKVEVLASDGEHIRRELRNKVLEEAAQELEASVGESVTTAAVVTRSCATVLRSMKVEVPRG